MASKAARDEMIMQVMDALERNIETDASLHFLNAAAIVDTLAERYTFKRKKIKETRGNANA